MESESNVSSLAPQCSLPDYPQDSRRWNRRRGLRGHRQPPSIRLGSSEPLRGPAATTARTPRDFPAISARKESEPMKPGLRPGASRVNRITIGPERTISFMGDEARTYATPAMIRDIEYTCRDLILEHADAGEDSVGMEVAVKHLAPTLMGMTVEITVRVVAGDRRKGSFEGAGKDELDDGGAGTHVRFVVETAKTFERLKAKAARLAAHRGSA